MCRTRRLGWGHVFSDQEFVADELALLMNVHPRTGMSLMAEAVRAARYPELLQAWEEGDLSDRHGAAGRAGQER